MTKTIKLEVEVTLDESVERTPSRSLERTTARWAKRQYLWMIKVSIGERLQLRRSYRTHYRR